MVANPTLPTLRSDLRLLEGAADEQGDPSWLIFDPARNSYFNLTLQAFQVLQNWQAGTSVTEFIKLLSNRSVEIDEKQLGSLIRFVEHSQLIQSSTQADSERLFKAKHGKKRHWLIWLIHNYLFVRIPLFRPDRFLDTTANWVWSIITPTTLWVIRALGIIGFLLVLRQWEAFIATFMHFFSWSGLAFYGLTLVGLKVMHELGHAYTSHRLGIRVASIGVAFLVLFPIMYTDTTDAWRLRDRYERLRIVLAGVKTEIHIALLATFLWSFLPDGVLRSIAFFVATTSWVTSLAVNISPFMRFDGYYAMSDVLDAKNLQPRSFALARWNLRKVLFGWTHDLPEVLSPGRHRLFVIYSYATWVYRFFFVHQYRHLGLSICLQVVGHLPFCGRNFVVYRDSDIQGIETVVEHARTNDAKQKHGDYFWITSLFDCHGQHSLE